MGPRGSADPPDLEKRQEKASRSRREVQAEG